MKTRTPTFAEELADTYGRWMTYALSLIHI